MDKVLVATSCRAENARFVDFYRSRDEIRLPPGSEKALYPGFFPEFNINDAVRKLLREDFTHLFVLDDDVIAPPNTVERLLSYNVDIVSANLLTRTPPYGPYLYDSYDGDGLVSQRALDNECDSLTECYAVGMGATLIKREVLYGLKDPWFEINKKIMTYDLYFCHKAKKNGFKVFYANKVPAGHLILSTIWPNFAEGKFITTAVLNNHVMFNMPKAEEEVPGKLFIPGADRIDVELMKK